MALTRRERERQARKSEIITAAEKLFFEKGFDNTSMDEIAKASEFTKRTVYQYFASKEDLFYAVALKGAKQLMSYIQGATEKGGTGFEKVRFIREASFRFSKEHPDTFHMMHYAQFIRTNLESSPNFQEIGRLNAQLFAGFGSIIEEGRKDGSIRSDFEIPIGTFSLFFMTTGFLTRLSEAGGIYSTHYGISAEALADFTFDLMDRVIKPINGTQTSLTDLL